MTSVEASGGIRSPGVPLRPLGVAVAVFFLMLCAGYLYVAVNTLAFGSPANPKSGFLPTITGGGGTLLSAVNLLLTLREPGGHSAGAQEIRRVLLFVLGLFAYAALLGYAGFLIATLSVSFYLLVVSTRGAWKLSLALAAGVSLTLYLLFTRLLLLSLP